MGPISVKRWIMLLRTEIILLGVSVAHLLPLKCSKGDIAMNRKIKFLAVSVALIFVACTASAQSAALIKAAKKDGKVVAYGSLESDTVDAIKQAFEKQTGLE